MSAKIEPLTALRIALSLVGLLAAVPAALPADDGACERITAAGRHYTICTFDVRKARLRLFLAGTDGRPYGGFAAIAEALKPQGDALAFAMNAGMFRPDFRPVGLYVEAGRQLSPANTRGGPGNFHMKPNGVFYFDSKTAGILETGRFLKAGLKPDYATQSGPMLIIGGVLHPKIEASGTSEKIRNGVGVRDGHVVVFAISEEPVTFYEFAILFRDRLRCPDALFLDGSVSSLYAPGVSRDDGLLPLGPIVGVVEKVP
ncbi:MAG TPA: phosphodiester glycosidase family protein [Methylovirgula sp.]|nr:phosphodiester glycosidase family protein [Methylovirgula sp.]